MNVYLFYRTKRSTRVKFFQQQLKMLCSSPICFDKNVRERSFNVLKHILCTLIRCSQCDPGNNANITRLKNIASDTLNQLINLIVLEKSLPRDNQRLLIQLFKEGKQYLISSLCRLKNLVVQINNYVVSFLAEVPNSTQKRCFTELLKYIVTNPSFSERPLDLEGVIRYQEKFSNSSYLIESQSVGSVINLVRN